MLARFYRYSLLILLLSFITNNVKAQKPQWIKQFRGDFDNDKDDMIKVKNDSVGNIYVLGKTKLSSSNNPQLNFGEVLFTGIKDSFFISKYDFAGNFLWAKNLGFKTIYTWAVSKSGKIYFSTSKNDNTSSNSDGLCIVSFDKDGKYLWQNQATTTYSIGHDIAFDENENIYVTGEANKEIGMNGTVWSCPK